MQTSNDLSIYSLSLATAKLHFLVVTSQISLVNSITLITQICLDNIIPSWNKKPCIHIQDNAECKSILVIHKIQVLELRSEQNISKFELLKINKEQFNSKLNIINNQKVKLITEPKINLSNNSGEMRSRVAQEHLSQPNQKIALKIEAQTSEIQIVKEQLQREIVEHQQTQQALQQQSAAVSAAIDGIAILNQNSEYIYLNQAYVELFGYNSDEDLIGKTWQKLYYPDEINRFERDIFPLLQQNGFWRGEATGKKCDRTTFVTEVSLTLTNDGSLIWVCRDITSRRQMEASLQASEERFRQTFEQAAVGIADVGLDGRFLQINQKFCDIVGYSAAELLINTFFDITHSDDLEIDKQYLQQLLSGEIQTFSREKRYRRQDNSTVWVNFTVSLVRSHSGDPSYFVVVIKDISDRKQTEAELRDSLEREKELNELKSRFVTTTSHEFRTPLTTILGCTELLKHYSHNWTDDKKLVYLNRIQTTVQHLNRMLDDVLLLGKAEAGKIEFKPEKLDIVEFCSNLVQELQQIPGHENRIVFINQGNCINACMDEKLLRHIFTNLLSNAIKYSSLDSQVNFELTCDNKKAVFKIQDRGIGIPPEDQNLLFEPFHRARNVTNIPGTGLGLVIAKKAVDLHNGAIAVQSEIAIGTIFTVTMPLM